MQKRTLIVLASLLVALAAWVAVFEIRGEKERERERETEKRVFALEDAAIQRISLDGPGGPLTIERVAEDGAEGEWRLVEPKALPADQQAADALAEALRSLTSTRTIEATSGPGADFGLEEGAAKVAFVAAGREGPSTLILGRSTPFGDGRYARVEGETTLRIVPALEASALEKTVSDLRDRRVASFTEGAARKVGLTSPGGNVDLAREGDTWWVLGTPRWRADRVLVRNLLSDLGSLKARDFPEPGSEGEALAPPSHRVAVDLGEGGRIELALGGEAEGGTTFARRLPDGELVTVAKYVVEGIARPAEQWRALAVADLDAWMGREVDATWRGQALSLVKDEQDAWKVSVGGSEAKDLPSARASDLLRELTGLKATHAGEPGAATPGQELGRFRISQSNGPEVRFTVAREGDECWARVEGDPAAMALPSCAIEEFLNGFVKDPAGGDPTAAR